MTEPEVTKEQWEAAMQEAQQDFLYRQWLTLALSQIGQEAQS